jgi:hypothetical protein
MSVCRPPEDRHFAGRRLAAKFALDLVINFWRRRNVASSVRPIAQPGVTLLFRMFWLLAAMVILTVSQAMAQTSWSGPNGGIMVDAGGFHVELLVKNTEYRVNVFDHVDKPIPVAAATAVATVMVGDDKEKLSLQPVSANTFSGTGTMKRSGAAKVLILLKVPDQATAIARFDVP